MSTLVVDAIENSSAETPFQPTAGTAQATTSGTAFDFTGIPSWVKRVTFLLDGCSLSGTDSFLVQLGDAGGIETSGYISYGALIANAGNTLSTSTAGVVVRGTAGAVVVSCAVVFENVTGNDWLARVGGTREDASSVVAGGGVKSLSGTLTQARLTRTGTDTFDAGQVSIIYE